MTDSIAEGHGTANGLPSRKESPGSGQIRIILADSQAIYRVGMKKVFALEEDLHVVAQADRFEDLQEIVASIPADVLLLEGHLLADSVDALPKLASMIPHVKIIMQMAITDESYTVELYRKGVRGIVPRSISPELLVKCIRKIAGGETWIDNKSVNLVIEAYRSQATALNDPKSQPRLSPKELEIIACITQGKRNKEIASQIGTTEQVIKNYLRKIYEKLGVSDRLELALYCLHKQIGKRTKEQERSATEA